MSLRHIPRASGIYRIVNSATGKFYIGSAEDLYTRAHCHLSQLRSGTHGNPHLLSAWRLYGSGAIRFEVVELAPTEHLREREQFYLDATGACDPEIGYNIATKSLRVPPTDEQRKLMASCKPGRVCAEETKRKISATLLGRKLAPRSDEYRRKMSLAKRGKPFSEAARENMRIAQQKHSREHPSQPNKSHPHTEETKRRLSEILKQRPPFSEEHRKKISLAHTGKKRGPYKKKSATRQDDLIQVGRSQ